jgi:hypothetical protein
LGSSLLAATLLLGQVTDVQIDSPPSQGRRGIFGGRSTPDQPGQPRGLFSWFSRSRWQNWNTRSKDQQEPPLGTPYVAPGGPVTIPATPASNPGIVVPTAPTPLDFRKMPTPSGQITQPSDLSIGADTPATRPVQQTALRLPTASSTKSPLLPRLANKVGRDEKFEWVTGQLEIENGKYILYYATPETVDPYHGRIILQPQQVDMSQFHRGDLVSARGDLIQRMSPLGATPIYRSGEIHMIEPAR